MSYNSCKIAELIATRISHDLAGGIGSFDNMLECLEAGEIFEEEDKKILEKTAKDLRARQQFLRIAFGVSTKSLSVEEIKKLCDEYTMTVGSHNYKTNLVLKNAVPELAKYICLCVMIANELVIKNADVEIEVNKNNIIIKINSDSKLSETKINSYQQIINNDKIDDDGHASQIVQLIYLRELLGSDVPFNFQIISEQSVNFIIG